MEQGSPAAQVPVHSLVLGAGMRVYLPSDGVFDQPGGAHGFGFGREPFEKLLLQLADVPMQRHADILENTLKDYRGASAQRDDITVLGFSAQAFAQQDGQ